MTRPPAPPRDLDLAIARLLSLGALASMVLLSAGVALMLIAGRSPLEPDQPGLDLARLPADLVALRPEGFLWLGLVVVIATPASRVLAAAVGFALDRERLMALVSVAILAVIGLGVVLSAAQA